MIENSFEHNQSFPVAMKSQKRTSFGLYAKAIQNLTGEEYNSYSYSKELPQTNSGFITKSSNASSFCEEGDTSHCSVSVKSPGKALVTLHTSNLRILTSNKVACDLFGYTSEELIGLDFPKLLSNSGASDAAKTFLRDVTEAKENTVVGAGKVVDVFHKKGFEMPVSLWVRKVENEGDEKQCCIIVLEPVKRLSSSFEFNENGEMLACDEQFALFHGFQQSSDIIGHMITSFMPSFVVPVASGVVNKQIRLQRLSSTAADGSTFPVTVYISSHKNGEKSSPCKVCYQAQLWIFPNLSGVITCKSDGQVLSVNENLALFLFGYNSSEISRLNVIEIIPDLLDHVENCNLYNSAVPQIEMDSSFNFSYTEPEISKNKEPNDTTIESWIEVSILGEDGKEKAEKIEEKTGKHAKFLDKVNCLLNHSGTNDAPHDEDLHPLTEKFCKETSESSDSAIHSVSSIDKSSKPKLPTVGNGKDTTKSGNGKESLQSSYSDYHSADGSQTANLPPQVTVDRSSVSSQASHDVSSFVIVDDQDQGPHREPYFKDKGMGPNIVSAMGKLCLGSEVTSTPVEYGRSQSRISNKVSSSKVQQNGWCKGKYKHKDGAMIDLWYSIDNIGHDEIICLKIHSQLNITNGCSLDAVNRTMFTSASTLPSLSPSSSILDKTSINESHGNVEKLTENEETRALIGEFNERYNIMKTIGMGAFGFVRIVQSKVTKREFVVKFIKKEKILEECWVKDEETDDLIPMEVSLLLKFNHPNIVRVLEYFENEYFFSMIMEKHGVYAMDLFEFIDRSTNLDEPLCSFIFRQIVSAIDYLHAHNVLHRDIKDENIIIDEKFSCKLIDFGSATFMKPGCLFGTFCGTIEYCSPEVLLGNKYRGPELELWSLGVTLYTLVFGENPFKNIEETLKCELYPPFEVSRILSSLIDWLLQPEPEFRCTMQELKECPWVCQTVNLNLYSWNEIVRTPAGSLESSLAQEEKDPRGHLEEFDQENLSEELCKLTTETKRKEKVRRNILAPLNNVQAHRDLNNTI